MLPIPDFDSTTLDRVRKIASQLNTSWIGGGLHRVAYASPN
jgi:hypothetical protein